MKQTVVALYSPNVGTKSHATSCTVPACLLLAKRGLFKPVLVTGSSFSPPEALKNYELVPLDVDFSNDDASRFLRFGRLGKPLRGVSWVIRSWRHLRRLADFLNSRSDIDLVHFFDYEYLTLSRFIRQKRTKNMKVVVTVYQSNFANREVSWRSFYKRMIYSNFRAALLRAHGIIVYGDFIKERLISEMKFSEEASRKIFVARYHSGNSEPTMDKTSARQKLGIPESQKVVLVFGVLREDKRIDLIIKACAHAQSKPFLIVAGSPWTLSEADVFRWIRESKLEGRVLAHLRWMEDSEISTYYGAADLFLSAYDEGYVGQSGPLNMCRAFRLPAVVSDGGELGYYVRKTGVGLLAKGGNYQSFASKIDEYFASEDLRGRLVQALDNAASAFSWDYFVGQLETCYQHALAC